MPWVVPSPSALRRSKSVINFAPSPWLSTMTTPHSHDLAVSDRAPSRRGCRIRRYCKHFISGSFNLAEPLSTFSIVSLSFLSFQALKPDATGPPPVEAVSNPYAVARPHATELMLARQTSFRGFNQLQAQAQSPFKKQLSLRYLLAQCRSVNTPLTIN